MEASDGQVRSVVDTLVKVINALETAGIEIIGENATSNGAGRWVRLKDTAAGSQPKRVPSMLSDQAGEPQAENDAICCAAGRVHADTGKCSRPGIYVRSAAPVPHCWAAGRDRLPPPAPTQ